MGPPIEETPAPIFSETLGHVDFSQDGFNTNATVASKNCACGMGFRNG